MSIDNGGAAFPRPIGSTLGKDNEAQDGMSLRDYFAARALQGLISKYGNDGFDWGAKYAFEYADAMLKERER